MKDIINNYYNFEIDSINEYENYSSFILNGEVFYFVYFNRSEDELNELVKVSIELKKRGTRVHDIILNKDKQMITKIGNNKYILLKVNIIYDEIVSFETIIDNSSKLILNNRDSSLYRNNWGYLWSSKIDYFEYQIKELGKDKKIVLDSFSYYIGLSENAIIYVNHANKYLKTNSVDKVSLSHRRIFYPNYALNYYNPLSFIFDLEVRDIAEYLKMEFFNGEDSLLDLKTYLKQNKLSNYSYSMLYARLLYPSYYFDIYESIMNNNANEDNLIKIIDRVDDYELFLKEAYIEISKYYKLEEIDWIIKKQSN